ncbi:hypothetical protein THASP1DRAFT_22265 [Thamnocephalis sphaerospora]|uniref:Uncharacterized protein n=1 Tax=Thamnocephalis sphaerospora TaxID=78915 RepID=A0A4P9XUQ9_9FUNG|nr:hypothetical protein THASP1DRAFT_22265 [Thamnocephalis sphaerospora]|eukprot:RKP09968.1 hypothetical protein THASP1DRAFT_22265 [Thamnocephalis sphaerospora]
MATSRQSRSARCAGRGDRRCRRMSGRGLYDAERGNSTGNGHDRRQAFYTLREHAKGTLGAETPALAQRQMPTKHMDLPVALQESTMDGALRAISWRAMNEVATIWAMHAPTKTTTLAANLVDLIHLLWTVYSVLRLRLNVASMLGHCMSQTQLSLLSSRIAELKGDGAMRCGMQTAD